MQAVVNALNATRPLWQLAAALAALMTAWSLVSEMVPILKQIYAVKIPIEKTAIVAGALALVGGSR